MANQRGQPCEASYYSLGGVLTITAFDATRYELPSYEPNPEDVRRWLREEIVDAIIGYAKSGRFTDKELFTVCRIWRDGWSLRRVAAAEKVKPQAIRERIEGNKFGHGGLVKKAPQFCEWWAFKNRNRKKK